MSFTRQVKSELLHTGTAGPCCRRSELAAFILLRGYLSLREGRRYLSITVESSAVARRLFSVIKENSPGSPQVIKEQGSRLGKVQYIVQLSGDVPDILPPVLRLHSPGLRPTRLRGMLPGFDRRCCRRAFLRGVFLAGGALSVPRSGYHLELNCGSKEDARLLRQLMHSFGLDPVLRERKEIFFLYVKDGETIAEFLRIIGAHHSLLALESGRVVKSMRSSVNRLVNCETANLEKVVASAQRQLAAIREVERTIGLDNLPAGLREAARLRLRYPEASLRELGEMLSPSVGKSGMNHRFRQLERLAAGPNRSRG